MGNIRGDESNTSAESMVANSQPENPSLTKRWTGTPPTDTVTKMKPHSPRGEGGALPKNVPRRQLNLYREMCFQGATRLPVPKVQSSRCDPRSCPDKMVAKRGLNISL